MKTPVTRAAVLLAALLLNGTGSFAAESGNGWRTEIAPYAWLAGVSGDFTTNGLPVHTNESFSDIPDVLDFGGMLVVESSRDRAAILFAIIPSPSQSPP